MVRSSLCIPLLLIALAALPARGQIPYAVDDLQLALRKLEVLGSVLYIAAHPDDENTAFLATMARDRHLRTGYLALTRGEGGQNLIGPEQGAALGIIRTQELLAARRIDGAEQFFTRAIDFGYSKSTGETLALWGRDEILGDIVRVIRSFRPDVIVTRFAPERGGHGHHTASAVLAYEAFRAAADPARYPEQLSEVEPWQARRIVWNVFRFSGGPGDEPRPSSVEEDLGAYNALLGLSMGEIAGRSRSMHRSQGFGAREIRGSWTNWFEHVDGDTAHTGIMDGVELTWGRIPDGAAVGRLLAQASRSFDHRRPASILPLLLEAHHRMEHIRDPWVTVKRGELLDVILGASGLWVDAVASADRAVPGSDVEVTVTVLNRSDIDARLERVSLTHAADTLPGIPARPNMPVRVSMVSRLPGTIPPSQPYWLVEPPLQGRYRVGDRRHVGRPDNPPVLTAAVRLTLQGHPLRVTVPVHHRWVDPARGELSRPFAVVPPASVSLSEGVVVSVGDGDAEVSAVVSGTPGLTARVSLELPPGWSASPAERELTFDSTLTDRTVRFRVTGGGRSGTLRATVRAGEALYASSLRTIAYDHFAPRVFLDPCEVPVVNLDLETPGTAIGYIQGSGDEIPRILEQLGYRVELLSDEDLETADLGRFDAIVAGVRAYNVRTALRVANHRLLEYVRRGGRYVVQYVTRQELGDRAIGPYPFTVSRDRVSVEDAPVTMLHPDHPLLTTPNRITQEDFDGWVQERGLYFAGEWDSRYETVLSSHDPGEEPLAGGLIIAPHGEGEFCYTGYSWFRQLPAGVPGAFRLFVNLITGTPR